MKDLSIKAVATNGLVGEALFYYREEHEWCNLNEAGSKWFADKMQKLTERIGKLVAKPGDGDLTVTFSATVDDVVVPVQIASGVTRNEMLKFQEMVQKVGDRDSENCQATRARQAEARQEVDARSDWRIGCDARHLLWTGITAFVGIVGGCIITTLLER